MTEKTTDISRVARGTAGEVVDFAQRRVFSPGEKIGNVPAGAPRRNLQWVLCDLLASEINAGLQTFAFDIVRVWIGDELNGFDAVAEIGPGDPACSDDAAIAHWLHETAIRLNPESEYAKAYRS